MSNVKFLPKDEDMRKNYIFVILLFLKSEWIIKFEKVVVSSKNSINQVLVEELFKPTFKSVISKSFYLCALLYHTPL